MSEEEFLKTEILNHQDDIDHICDVLDNEELEASLYGYAEPYRERYKGSKWKAFLYTWEPGIRYKLTGLIIKIDIVKMIDHQFIQWFLSDPMDGSFKTLYTSQDESICRYIDIDFYKNSSNSILARIEKLTGYKVVGWKTILDTLVLNLSKP